MYALGKQISFDNYSNEYIVDDVPIALFPFRHSSSSSWMPS
jgi:hypothetical protein